MEEGIKIRRYVGIGASAGGVEALQALFKDMPVDTGASFIVVQHLSPDAVSMMDKILGKSTTLPVKLAADGMLLEPDTVYLNIPGMTLTVEEGIIHLQEVQNRNQLYLPINLMLNSLSSDRDSRTIAVILSGSGSDGTAGIGAVKESGGIVIVQKPAEAQYASMPLSAISTGMVDVVENLDRIGAAIYDYMNNPNMQHIYIDERLDRQDLAEDYERILDAVSRYSKIDFSWYKPNTIIRRIERRITINKFTNMNEYLDYLLSSEEEKALLCDDILIGVTSFFRDLDAFKSLGENVVRNLVRHKRTIRIWSVACSSGEEAYSLAILVCEYMDRMKINLEVKIFATDVDEEAIAFAQKGIYHENVMECMDQQILEKYFTKQEGGYIISERIRKMIIFARHNIFRDAPFSKLDLIVCRNMFIYVKSEMQQRAIESFYQLLNADGYLFLGSSESPGEIDSAFNVIDKKWKIYRKKEGYVGKNAGLFLFSNISESKRIPDDRDHTSVHQKIRTTGLFEKMLSSLAGPSVLVNGYGKIIQVIQGGGRYLSIQDGQFDNSINSCFVPGLTMLLNHMMHDVKEQKKSGMEKNIEGIDDYPGEILNVKVHYFDFEEGEYYLLQIQEGKAPEAQENKTEKASLDLRELENRRIRELEKALGESNWNLKIAVEESESQNEELQATNEELLASNEELQSTNEEMQSVNEELYTMNSEYQNKIQELTTANADFDNLLMNAEVGALYIDENMRIRKITPIIIQNTNLRLSDLERPVNHINFIDSYQEFIEDVEIVARYGTIVEKEVADDNNVTWLVRIRPYYENAPQHGGVLVTMFDITKRLEASKFELKRLTDSVPGGVLRLHYEDELIIDYANDSFYAMTQYTAAEMKDRFHNRYNRIIDQECWPVLRREMEGLKTTGQVMNAEYRIWRRDGSSTWNSMQAVLFRDGNRMELQCIIMDISLLKKYEEQLKKERDYYNSLYHNVVCGIVQYESGDDMLRCYNANEEAIKILGYCDLEEFRSHAVPDIIYEEDREEVTKKLLSIHKAGECISYEHRIRAKDGTIRWMNGAAKVVTAPDGRLLVQSTFMDTTEEKRALEQLKKERDQYDRLYKMLYNMAICGIIQANVTDGSIVSVNYEALRILGEKETKGVERKLFRKNPGNEQEKDFAEIGRLLCSVRKGKSRRTIRRNLHLSEDNIISIEGAADWIMEDEKGKIIQFTFLDVTERENLKEAEMKLAVAVKASEAKSSFLSKMSHEIRTPMNGITGMIDSAMLYIHDEDKVQECLMRMKRSMDHLQQIVNDVLDMSKIESGKMEVVEKRFDLKALLRDTVEEFQFYANDRGVGLSRAGNIIHGTVVSDPLRLREILGNLIGNAIKFTAAAGYVVLIVEEQPVADNRSEYTFHVKDTGCGISEESKGRIFGVFEQGAAQQHYGSEGSGLGLAICKNLVSLLGGELQVESEEGKGAEFFFTLTLETVKEAAKKKKEIRQTAAFVGRRVLLAEDNELNAEIAENFLHAFGFEVDIAVNGREALEQFLRMNEYYYDLILMDIQMPVMNGYDATVQIRGSGRADAQTIPILAMSANAFSEDVQASIAAGMNDHIAKPVDMKTLIYKLTKVLRLGKKSKDN